MDNFKNYRTKAILNLLLDMGATEHDLELIPVHIKTHSKANNCFENVKLQVEQHGGELVYGWLISATEETKLFRCFVEAIPYAFWRDSNGSLFDITPHPDGLPSALIVKDTEGLMSNQKLENKRKAYKDNEYIRRMFKMKHLNFVYGQEYFKTQKEGTPLQGKYLEVYKHMLNHEVILDNIFTAHKNPNIKVLTPWDNECLKLETAILKMNDD